MDTLTSCLCLILALLPLLLLKLKRRDNNNNNSGLRLPPSPWRLPVIGNLHHLMVSPLPYHTMANIARRLKAPIIYLQLGEVPVVVASSPDAAREILQTNDLNFATRPWNPTVKVLTADGDGLVFARYDAMYKLLRKISMQELLSASCVKSFRGVREEEVGRLMATILASPPGEAVNLSQRIAELANDTVVRSIIGHRFERQEEFLENVEEGVKIAPGFTLGDLFPSSRLAGLISGTARQAAVIHRKLFQLVDYSMKKHEDERRATAMATSTEGEGIVKEDLVDALLRLQKEGTPEGVPLTMGMIKSVILDLFIAGGETSARTLQWAMSELLRHPEVMHRAQAELREKLQGKPTVTEDDLVHFKYIRLIIKETLRLHPVVPLLLPRACRESCKVMGYDIPKGATVLVNVWAICRDPKYWDDASTFKPERFEATSVDSKGTDFEYTPFGAGRRICPGMAFGQASMELVLAALLYHFDWKLPAGMLPSDLDMTEEMGVSIRRKHDLYLHPVVSVPPHA